MPQTFMRNNRINLNESPNPNHINYNNLSSARIPILEDHEPQSQRLFTTPERLNTQVPYSPALPTDPYYTHSPRRNRRSGDISTIPFNYIENQQQLQSRCHAIDQRLEYSEELLANITPVRTRQIAPEPQQGTTIRRPTSIHGTPDPQSRGKEKGLKILAHQAYQFVTQQKKTTYKEVAGKLIGQPRDKDDENKNKSGQKNIKRRVYDALNVLIALGLLKRSGHKILGKKTDFNDGVYGKGIEKERQRLKEEQMGRQLEMLKADCEKKTSILAAKRKVQRQIKLKIQKIRQLQTKNISSPKVPAQQKLQFPIIAICLGEPVKQTSYMKEQLIQIDERSPPQSEQSTLKLWQGSPMDFCCSFGKDKRVELMGELDLVLRWRGEESKRGGESWGGEKRRRNR